MIMARVRKPSDSDLNCAALWLEAYDEGTDEGDACRRVAAWLDQLIEDRMIQTIAREKGVSAQLLRARMTQLKKDKST